MGAIADTRISAMWRIERTDARGSCQPAGRWAGAVM